MAVGWALDPSLRLFSKTRGSGGDFLVWGTSGSLYWEPEASAKVPLHRLME